MISKTIDHVAYSRRLMPDHDRELFEIISDVTRALEEGGKAAGSSPFLGDYTGSYFALKKNGTAEAAAYARSAFEFWDAIVDFHNERIAPDNIADLAQKCLENRQAAFDALLPEYNHRRDIDDLFERFLDVVRSNPPKP
jgi:hypothetical protein